MVGVRSRRSRAERSHAAPGHDRPRAPAPSRWTLPSSHNLTVMRFWVPGVSPSYALQTSPGVYNEGMLKGAVGQQFPAAYLLNLGWHCNLTCDVTVAPGPLLTTAWTHMAAGHVCSYRYGHWASGLHLTLTETIIRPS